MKKSQAWFSLGLPFFFVTSAGAVEKIPDRWKKNPDFRIVYESTKAIPGHLVTVDNRGYGKVEDVEFKVGTKFALSQRSLSDQLDRDRDHKDTIGLLVVGGRSEDDPGGGADATIPLKDLDRVLKPTKEAAPLHHWHKAYRKAADTLVPNLRPNFYYQSSFPFNVYAAQKTEGERIRLVYASIRFRLIQPSPQCRDDELTIRLKDEVNKEGDPSGFYGKRRDNNPELVLAGWWYGTDYCMRYTDFVDEGHQQVAAGKGEPNPETLPDALKWKDVSERYYKKFLRSGGEMKGALNVNPFSEADEKAGRAGPAIRVIALKDLAEKDRTDIPKEVKDGWVAEYAGPLYYTCAGGICRAQGYRILIRADGTVDRFLKNRLYYWNGTTEELLEDVDIRRMLKILNDEGMLEKTYAWAKGDIDNSFSAGMSRISELKDGRRAGNTFGTVVIHLSHIRKAVRPSKNWPVYDGKAPGGEE